MLQMGSLVLCREVEVGLTSFIIHHSYWTARGTEEQNRIE